MTPETAIWLLKHARDAVRAALEQFTDDDLHWRPAPGGNSAAVLARHLAGSERFWIGEVAGGREVHRDRPAEFADDRPGRAEVLAALDAAEALTDEVLGGLGPDGLDAAVPYPKPQADYFAGILEDRDGTPYGPRYLAVVHMLQHYDRHLGQLLLMKRMLRR